MSRWSNFKQRNVLLLRHNLPKMKERIKQMWPGINNLHKQILNLWPQYSIFFCMSFAVIRTIAYLKVQTEKFDQPESQ